MGITFTYLEYNKKILEQIPQNKDFDELVIFNSYTLKNRYLKDIRKTGSLFKESCKVQTFDEFFSTLFPTDRIILRENTRGVTLYSSLSKGIKEKIGGENFSDFTMIALEFFKFYKELNHSLKDSINSLEPWQKSRVQLFNEMKKEYDNYLEKNSFIPLEWIQEEKTRDIFNLEKLKKITIIDKVSFTPLERETIMEISKKIGIEIMIQCSPSDFCEENFLLKGVNIPENIPNIRIYETGEEIETGINILKVIDEENNIFTPDIESCNLEKIFPQEFKSNFKDTLDQRELYRFISGINELYKVREYELKNSILLVELEKYIKTFGFRVNYSISQEDIDVFYEILNDGYKYFSTELISMDSFYSRKRKILYKDLNISRILSDIYNDLEKIDSFRRVEEFLDFFKENCKILEISKSEVEYVDILEKFSKALNQVKAVENISSEITFEKLYPGRVPSGILTLILDDMNGLDLAPKKESHIYKGYVKPLDEIVEYQGESVFFIDIDSSKLPSKKGGGFLTDEQKKMNDLPTREDERLESKYRFFQGVFASRASQIYYIKSEKNGVGISPFLDELCHKKNIQVQKSIISSQGIIETLRASLSENSDLTENENENITNITEETENNCMNSKEWNYPKSLDDISKKGDKAVINFSPYSFETMRKCYFRFYLDNILQIDERAEDFSRVFGNKDLGTVIHKFLEIVAIQKMDEIKTDNNFALEEEFLRECLDKIIYQNRYSLPIFYKNYFKDILCEIIIKNTKDFYKNLERELKKSDILEFAPEKLKEKVKASKDNYFIIEDEYLVRLNGQMDLVIETELGKTIIDYKTGAKNDVQLDFYSILLYGTLEGVKKGIFNVLNEGRVEYSKPYAPDIKIDKNTGLPKESKNLTPEKLENEIRAFASNETYTLAPKETGCAYCKYTKICRKEKYTHG